ncbi:MAG: DUF1569 domain-containing protein [Ignavibacteriales bacterium]|nr:DUF1569 domain-containing protein [Ignavibacteriales bacterium]
MNNLLIDKIKLLVNLRSDTKQLWGKMTAQHMVEHLILAVRTSNSKLNIGCFNPPEKIPTLKRFLMSGRPLPKEFINPLIGEGLLPLEYENLEEAKLVLEKELEDYYKYFEEHPDATLLNPTFGELNKNEWDVFHEKHFTHHLSQFGLL